MRKSMECSAPPSWRDCFRRVGKLLLGYSSDRIGVVVSAMSGVTDALLHLVSLAEQDDEAFNTELHTIGEHYSDTAHALIDGDRLIGVLDNWGTDAEDIKDILKTIALAKSAPQRSRAHQNGAIHRIFQEFVNANPRFPNVP